MFNKYSIVESPNWQAVKTYKQVYSLECYNLPVKTKWTSINSKEVERHKNYYGNTIH
jgi:ribosomal protein S18 acetylase RimI-like enzyme